MFDTHCHLNFKAYRKTLDDVILQAEEAGISHIMIPGTDVPTSQRAAEIAGQYEHFYAAAGIHPHHVFELYARSSENKEDADTIIAQELAEIEKIVQLPKVLAVGEAGMDRHLYIKTKYAEYTVTDEFIEFQRKVFIEQIRLAVTHKKSLIIHNREAVQELMDVLEEHWDSSLSGKTVFHCCEPEERQLAFALQHNVYIGVDGDITYGDTKYNFIKEVPLERLVLETDAPFLLPEPLRSSKEYPNRPSNLGLIAKTVADIKGVSVKEVQQQTVINGKMLFGLS